MWDNVGKYSSPMDLVMKTTWSKHSPLAMTSEIPSHPSSTGRPGVPYNHPKSLNVCTYLGVSENRGTPKWMVYDGKPY